MKIACFYSLKQKRKRNLFRGVYDDDGIHSRSANHSRVISSYDDKLAPIMYFMLMQPILF